MTTVAQRAGAIATSESARAALTVWTVILLNSGQGFRYALGIVPYVLLVVLTLIAVAVAFRPALRTLRPPFLIGAFVSLAALSVLWSATPAVTAVAVAVLIVTTLVAMTQVRAFSSGRFMELLYRGFQISLVMGVLFEAVVALVVRAPVPPLSGDLASIAERAEGTDQWWSENLLFEGGPVQGFVGNRNPFGAIALFTAILAIALLLDRRIRRVDGIATLAMALGVHALTMSATVTVSAIYVAGLLAAALAIRALPVRLKRITSFAVLGVTAVAAVLTIKYRAVIFGMLDRSSDATHRMSIWDSVIDAASERPEGWGFVSYWPVWQEPYSTIQAEAGVFTPHGHNAFLDTWLQLGLIGLVLLVVIVALVFGSAWRLVERASGGDSFVPLGWALLTAALVLQALTESRLLVEGGWYLLVALFCSGPPVFTLTIVNPEFVHTGQGRAARVAGESAAVAD